MTRTINATLALLLAVATPTVARSLRGITGDHDFERSLLSVYENNRLVTKTDKRMKQCVVFTAPHNLFLNDEITGGRRKKPEIHTDQLAKDLAKEIHGGYITWKREERDAAAKKFIAKQPKPWLCGVKGTPAGNCKKAWAALNSGRSTVSNRDGNYLNRDVNYLKDSERTHFGFMRALHTAKRRCSSATEGKSVPLSSVGGLHVDVHGMSDNTAGQVGQHFVIGTRAMETTINSKRQPQSGVGYKSTRSLKLRKAMAENLNGVLGQICNKLSHKFGTKTVKKKLGSNKGRPAECKVAIGYDNGKSTGWAYKSSEKSHLKFLGDWGKQKGEFRNSLSRISTEKALWRSYRRGAAKPFGCAVQVELSTQFRTLLYNRDGSKTEVGKEFVPQLARGFAKALKKAGCTQGAADTA